MSPAPAVALAAMRPMVGPWTPISPAVDAKPKAKPKRRQITIAVTITVPEWYRHARRALPATAVSALVHTILLIILGLAALKLDEPRPPVALEASLPRRTTVSPEERPIVSRVKTSVDGSVPPLSGVVAGRGAAGSNGAGAGGLLAGLEIAPPRLEGLRKTGSGGDGLTLDRTLGMQVAPQRNDGDGQGARFFDVPASGKNFAFVVDTSGSMFENARYLRCRQELIESIRSLKPGQKYFVVFFNHELHPMPGKRLTEAGPERVGKTLAWLQQASPAGTTEPWPGIYMALRMKPDAVYLLTDGNFDDEVLRKVIQFQEGASTRVPIHAIAFESEEGATLLKAIARATGGTYRFVP